MAGVNHLVGNVDVFPVLAERDYFNHAGVAPLPRPCGDAVRDFLGHFERHGFVGFDFPGPLERLRTNVSRAINADAHDVALVSNTSEAISLVALGLTLAPGDRVVVNAGEYPANVYPWHEACLRSGATLVVVPETHNDDGTVAVREDDLLEAAGVAGTKVLAVSHVQWGTGQRMDLGRLGAFCRDRDVLFSVDAIQSLGAMPIDVVRDRVDFLQAGGHKWMLGTMGAAALYVRRERLNLLRPAAVGWGSVVDPFDWENVSYVLRPDARRYDYGSPALAPVIATGVGLGLLVDAGLDTVWSRIDGLCRRFEEGVTGIGCRVACPRERSGEFGGVGGMVCFTPSPHDVEASKGLYRRLSGDFATELASRCGRVRFAPHVYNTDEQVDRLLDRIASALA